MPKFSIIIPVYNVENYIKKCLDSVFNQTYKDYEVIVVNDGTKDNSMDIVKNYDVKIINQKNGGLSSARNKGVEKANGEYIIFLDSDDYWEDKLLENINSSLDNNPDVVRFQIQDVVNDDVTKYPEEEFYNLSGKDAFIKIVKFHHVENAWCYAIKRKYYIDNKFKFSLGKTHEDFGLMPLVIFKAKKVNSITYIGYNYIKRENSIINSNDYLKTKKKVSDFYDHYNYLINETKKLEDSQIIRSFAANSLIIKIADLKGEDYKEYKKRLKEDKVYDNIISDNYKRKIKKSVMKISPKLFTKIK